MLTFALENNSLRRNRTPAELRKQHPNLDDSTKQLVMHVLGGTSSGIPIERKQRFITIVQIHKQNNRFLRDASNDIVSGAETAAVTTSR